MSHTCKFSILTPCAPKMERKYWNKLINIWTCHCVRCHSCLKNFALDLNVVSNKQYYMCRDFDIIYFISLPLLSLYFSLSLKVNTFLNWAFQVPSLASFHLAEHIFSLYCSGNFKASVFHLSAGSPVTVTVTFLLPAYRKGLCLIVILRDGLCTLEPVRYRKLQSLHRAF